MPSTDRESQRIDSLSWTTPPFDERLAIGFILLSALAYSLLPVLAAYALDTLDPLVYVAKSFFQYAILQTVVWALLRAVLRRESPAPFLLGSFPRTCTVILVSGVLIGISYSCLFASFFMINKAGASVLYETWPILVTIGLPLLIKRRFHRLVAIDVVYIGIAFIGIVLVVGSSAETESARLDRSQGETKMWLGYTLAISSAVSMALAVILKAHLMSALRLGRSAMPTIAYVEATHRLAGGTVLLAIACSLSEVTVDDLLRVDISMAFALLELVGASAFWLAIVATRRSIINLLWYLAPMLAVVWLGLLGLAQVSSPIVLGAALIIIANVLVQRRSDGLQRSL